jgi:predicted MFS family arabinose efflux permease
VTSPDLHEVGSFGTATPSPDSNVEAETTSWRGVASLSVTVFALVVSEFLPASLLTRIAADLGVSVGAAGQSVAITAIVAAIAGLTIPVLLPRLDRRHLLIALAALAVVSNLLVAVAPSYAVLLVARVLLGVAIGGFWSLAISVTARMVPPTKLGLGLTVVNIGVSLATVAAIPLGTLLGESLGWRWVFALTAGVALVAIVVQVAALPSVRSDHATGFRPLLSTLRSRLICLGLFSMALMGAGHFAGFTYIRPAATEVGGMGPDQLAALLLVYGVGIVIGNLVSGPLADWQMRVAVLLFPALLGASMIVFVLAGASSVVLFVVAGLWGVGFGALPTAISTWLARAEPTRLESVGGLQTAVFQVAVALGAFIGGLLVDGAGVQTALLAGGAASLVGALIMVATKPRAPLVDRS